MPQKMTRRYARIGLQTSSGTRRKMRMKSSAAKARTFRRSVAPAISTKDARMLSRSPSSSRWPKRMENSAPLPMHSPSRIEVRKAISVKDEPTAASAFFPRNLPTISVSAIL